MKTYYKKNTGKIWFGFMILSMASWSCKKFVTVPLPDTELTANVVFSDSRSLTAALNGIYAGLSNNESNAFIYPSLFADETTYKYPNSAPYTQAQQNAYTQGNDYGYYSTYYNTIYGVNAILGGIDKTAHTSPDTINQIKGECYFVRAYCYFQLVNFYGGVPLVTNIDVNANSLLSKSTPAAIYQQIITDLNAAVPILADNYAAQPRTRVNKQTANALLARVYLYTKDYAKAIALASTVISSPLYALNPDLNSVSLSTSTETIFQLYNQYGISLGGQYIPYDPNSITYKVRPQLLAAFEPGDNRKIDWLQSGTGPDSANYYPYKWKAGSYSPVVNPEYLILFRLAEMYLIRAEAYQNTNDVPDGVADINVIRHRAGLAPLNIGITQGQLKDTVASERRKELCFEGGQRWFDLNRTGETLTILSPIKPGIDAHALLLPFPQQDILFDPNLKQNPGY